MLMLTKDDIKGVKDMLRKWENKHDYAERQITKIKSMLKSYSKREITNYIEMFECKTSGKSMLNGGYATATDVEIQEINNSYIVHATVELGDYFDCEHPNKEIYTNCKYYIDKENYRLLTDKEIEERNLHELEEE